MTNKLISNTFLFVLFSLLSAFIALYLLYSTDLKKSEQEKQCIVNEYNNQNKVIFNYCRNEYCHLTIEELETIQRASIQNIKSCIVK